jgi:hypothetical protein
MKVLLRPLERDSKRGYDRGNERVRGRIHHTTRRREIEWERQNEGDGKGRKQKGPNKIR